MKEEGEGPTETRRARKNVRENEIVGKNVVQKVKRKEEEGGE